MTSAPDSRFLPPLELERLPPPIVEPMENAFIVPVEAGSDFSHGIYRADGSYCELSRTRISSDRFSARADKPTSGSAERLDGSYLFAGIGRHHFGHFLMETISRLWALDGRQSRFDGIIILPPPNINFAAILRRRLLRFFEILDCGLPIHLIKRPVRVEQLFVPAQGFGHSQWSVGTPEFRSFVRQQIDMTCQPRGPEKIYISRNRLKHRSKRIDQEGKVEEIMRAAGYTIFYPERHAIDVQCRVYRAAHTIVGGDGSAFHLVPFAMQPETRVGLIQRRARAEPVDAIARQIEAFTSVNLLRLNPLRQDIDESRDPSIKRENAQPIDLAKLRNQLEDAHFI